MTIEKILYTATATATGGREGQATSSDGALAVKLSTPRELGGAGGDGTNPEQLFAAGYSACFLGALKYVAGQAKVALPAETQITGKVGIGQIPTGFGIEAELTITAPVVYRWAYDYSVPGVQQDFIPQNVPNEQLQFTDKQRYLESQQ